MTRKLYEDELHALRGLLITMGQKVQERIRDTIRVIRTQDLDTARTICGADDEVDVLEHRIEQMCTSLIARQQPLASDLRTIAASLKIVTDMERVADQCEDICELVLSMRPGINDHLLQHLGLMLADAGEMFSGALSSLFDRDQTLAQKVIDTDDKIDQAFSRITLEVCSAIPQDSGNVMRDVDLLFIAKYIERIGDHATNIAEWTIYITTGIHPDFV